MSDLPNPRYGQRDEKQQARCDVARDNYVQRLTEETRDAANQPLLKPRNYEEFRFVQLYVGQGERAVSDALEVHRNGGSVIVTPSQAMHNRMAQSGRGIR